ncbi:MAG: type II secretion system F family protein [Lentisphaerae bacterium]|nr:type II secretion system F family protein [Lentisphaerota bacterium]
MPAYRYKAKQGPGRTVEGEVDAETRAGAVAYLEQQGLAPVWVREKAADADGNRGPRFRRRRITARDITVFTRQLASLTRSSVPILRALTTVVDQTGNLRLRRVVEDLEARIREGAMLSDALTAYPSLFPELYVNMVRSGESAGVLDTILTRLAEAREAEEEVRRKVQSAMAYPVLVLTVGVLTVFVLFSFFLPRVVALFKDYRELPLPTRLLIGTSGFFSANWYWIVIAALLLWAVYKRLAAAEKGRAFVDGVKLRLPLVRRFVSEASIARFARTLALLIEGGIPIDRALDLSGQTLGNAVLRDEVETARRDTVMQGMRLSDGLKRAAHFPAFVSNMVAVGEEGGRLEESLSEVAGFYEKEVEQQSRMATSLLEPILILVVGLVVGFIVASMLLPIFEIGTGG